MTVVSNMPMAEYQAMRALSAGGVWNLADVNEGCPLKFWLDSPWNQDREPHNAAHFDIGKAAHLAVLEPDKLDAEVVLHGFDEYRSNAAKDARDDALLAGKIPLKPAEWEIVEGLKRSIMSDPLVRGAFTGDGESEVTALWTDPDYGIPCKARADRVIEGGRILVDLKTAASAHPIGWSKALWQFGYFSRAAWYLDGWECATGRRPEDYWFAVVEKRPPHLTALHKLDEKDIEWGRIINRTAVATFTTCMSRGEWPGYRPIGANRPRAFVTSLPKYAQYLLHDRFEADELKAPKLTVVDIELANRFLAPHLEDETA